MSYYAPRCVSKFGGRSGGVEGWGGGGGAHTKTGPAAPTRGGGGQNGITTPCADFTTFLKNEFPPRNYPPMNPPPPCSWQCFS